MMTNPKSDKRLHVKKIIILSFGLVPVIFFGAVFLSWYLPFDPISPSSIELGVEPKFDALFGNNHWLFLFAENNKIIETNIYGDHERVVLDIVKATQNNKSELLYDFSISPDRKYLAVNYQDDADKARMSFPVLGNILIVEIASGKIIKIPAVFKDYHFEWVRPAYWLSPSVFLVDMYRFHDNDSTENEVFLRYDLHDLENPQAIEIDHCNSKKITKGESNVLLLSRHCKHPNQVLALDINGKRAANSEEKAFFKKCDWSRTGDICTRNLATIPIASIKVEHVAGYVFDGVGRWQDENWDRYSIYLNDKIIRITDSSLDMEPFWDPDLTMFIWGEWNKTFQMDIDGHYRFWHNGDYIGKIPNP